jgi:hypothetical protein
MSKGESKGGSASGFGLLAIAAVLAASRRRQDGRAGRTA